MFWHDNWVNQALVTLTPKLYSFAKNKQISVYNAFNEEDFTELFQLPLSQPAFLQMQTIQQLMQSLPLSEDNDRWLYSWGSDKFYSAKVHRILVGHEEIHPTYLQIALEKLVSTQA